jgi:ribosomal protein L40E
VEITSEDFKEEPATETPKEVLDKSGISPGTDKVEEIEIQEKIMEEIKEELQPEVQMVEEVEITEVMEISDRFNMSQSNIKLKLNGNAEAVFAFPNKKNEFYIDLFNMSSNYLSQAKIKIEGPPEVKLLVKFEWYGKVAPGKSKRRLFIIIPKEEGTFQLTAYLTSNKKPIIDTSFEVRVGKVGMTQEVSKPSMAPTEAETIKKTNCPFCDELINSDVSFCPHCGSNIKRKLEKSQKDVKDPKFCVKCGAELPSQAKFCIKCGSKLEY